MSRICNQCHRQAKSNKDPEYTYTCNNTKCVDYKKTLKLIGYKFPMYKGGLATVHYYGVYDLDEEGKLDSGVYDLETPRRAERRKK